MVHIELQDEDVERAALFPWLYKRNIVFRVYLVVLLFSLVAICRMLCRMRYRKDYKITRD